MSLPKLSVKFFNFFKKFLMCIYDIISLNLAGLNLQNHGRIIFRI